MFDKDVQIRGRHATYWKALAKTRGNAADTSNNFKIFENYMAVYMIAPIIGLMNERRGKIDPTDENKDTAGMLAEILIKNQSKLKYIYRLIVLLDRSEGLTDKERIDRAFRENENEAGTKAGLQLFHAYFLGGLEVLHESFVEQCTTDDDFMYRMYSFIEEFKREQGTEKTVLDIDTLLRRQIDERIPVRSARL